MKPTKNNFDINFRDATVKVGTRQFNLPRSRNMRIVLGLALVAGGAVGFLPVVGFWMLPLGFVILSMEFHAARKLRRRIVLWWNKRKRG